MNSSFTKFVFLSLSLLILLTFVSQFVSRVSKKIHELLTPEYEMDRKRTDFFPQFCVALQRFDIFLFHKLYRDRCELSAKINNYN